MVKILTVEQMRAVEKATDAAGVSYDEMMQHAGRAVAEIVLSAELEGLFSRIVVLIGPGNNGGDGLVAARLLHEESDAEVACYLLKPRGDDDPVYQDALNAGVSITLHSDDTRWATLKRLVGEADVVIDGLLGTGARLPVEGDLKKLLEFTAKALERPVAGLTGELPGRVWPAAPVPGEAGRPLVVAIDCPSGLDCNTGAIDPAALKADLTVTFAAAKYGQLAFPGAEAVGELIVAGIGTPEDLPEMNAFSTELVTGESVKDLLPPRPRDGHKGTFGRAVILAGSVNYTGAASLAGEGAYRVGAGLVTMAVPQSIYPVLAAGLRETTWLLLPHDMGVLSRESLDVFRAEAGEMDALLLGPGIGCEEPTAEFVQDLFHVQNQTRRGSMGFVSPSTAAQAAEEAAESGLPDALVIDADGLNLLARLDGWWKNLPDNTILTPHPGEMARLTGLTREEVLADRIGIASEKAAEWGCIVVLKGAFTVIASPDGAVRLLPFASDALATAGTGDVLAGCITGLLAQGLSAFDAAVAGAYVHGLAGRLAGETSSPRSVMAGDLLETLPEVFTLLDLV